MKKIIKIVISSFLIGACNSPQKVEKEINLVDPILNKLFNRTDSIALKYPGFNNYPNYIQDIAFINNAIYILGENPNNPLVKFNNNGVFLKNISKVGQGPGEYNSIPDRLCGSDGNMIVLNSFLNQLHIFKNDIFRNEFFVSSSENGLNEKEYERLLRISDVELYENNILLACYGSSKYHIILLNLSGEVIKKYFPLSDEGQFASLLSPIRWGIQKSENKFITHIVYPFKIFQFEFTEENLEKVSTFEKADLSNFLKIPYGFNLKNFYSLDTKSKIEFWESFSRIVWVINTGEYIIGLYRNHQKQKSEFRLFIAKGNKVVLDEKFSNNYVPAYLIPYDNELYLQDNFSKKDDPVITLHHLSLNEEEIYK